MQTLADRVTALAAALAVSLSQAGTSPAAEPEPVVAEDGEKRLFHKFPKDDEPDENISGAVCFDDNTCILVADESIAIQKIHLGGETSSPSYRIGKHLKQLYKSKPFKKICDTRDGDDNEDCPEADLEAIARSGNTVFVTGSLGNASNTGEKDKDRWFMARFDLDDEQKVIEDSIAVQTRRKVLKKPFKDDGFIEDTIDEALQCHGLNIEGLAALGDTLYFGLRGPSGRNPGEAIIVEASSEILIAKKPSDIGSSTIHTLTFIGKDGLKRERIGIRALEPVGDRLLIATADSGISFPNTLKSLTKARKRRFFDEILYSCGDVVDDEEDLNFSSPRVLQPVIWLWDPASNDDPVEIVRLTGKYRHQKLEGMAVIGQPSEDGKIDLLLTIDAPTKDTQPLAILRGIEIPPSQ